MDHGPELSENRMRNNDRDVEIEDRPRSLSGQKRSETSGSRRPIYEPQIIKYSQRAEAAAFND